MEIANMIYEFFGFEALNQSATLIELLDSIIKIGCGIFVTVYIIKCMCIACTISDGRFY